MEGTYPDPVTGIVDVAAELDVDFDLDIIPITLNYQYERPLTGNLSWYMGAGAGVAIVDVDVDADVVGGPSLDSLFGDGDETAFFGQIFAGLNLDVSEQFELFAGARWIYLDGIDGDTDLDIDVDVDSQDDFVIEAGGRFKF